MTESQIFNLAVWAWNKAASAVPLFDDDTKASFLAGARFSSQYRTCWWIKKWI